MNLAQMQTASVQEIAAEASNVLTVLARRIDTELHKRNADHFQANNAEKALAKWAREIRSAEIECGIIAAEYNNTLKEADADDESI